METEAEIQSLEMAFDALGPQSQTLCDESDTAICNYEDRVEEFLCCITKSIKTESASSIDRNDKTTIMAGAWPIEEELDDLLLITQFRALDEVARQTFDSVCEFYRITHDLRDEFANMKKSVEESLNRSAIELVEAEEDLEIKIAEEAQAKANLNSCSETLSWVSGESERNKDVRHVLRAGRMVAWGAGIMWAPALIAAAGMEIGAAARELERRSKKYQTQYRILHQEVQKIKKTATTLEEQAFRASNLFNRCDRLSVELGNKLENNHSQMKRLLNWKLATDGLCSKTREWRTKAEFFSASADEETAARLTHQLLDDIDGTYQAKVHERLLTWTAHPSAITMEEILNSRDACEEIQSIHIRICHAS